MNRYEITRVAGEPGDGPNEAVYQFLDCKNNRAEFVHIAFIGLDEAHAWNLAPGHGSYYLTSGLGRWHCSCTAASANRPCYHLHTITRAAEDMLPGLREYARANGMLRAATRADGMIRAAAHSAAAR